MCLLLAALRTRAGRKSSKSPASPQWGKIDKQGLEPQAFPMAEDDPLIIHDGRQSETAAAVARGAGRLLRQANYVPISEFVLPSGRRVDLIALDRSGSVLIVEVKSSVADFRADQKWTNYLEFCDLMYFAIPSEVPQELIPQATGLILADAWGAAFLRHPERAPPDGCPAQSHHPAIRPRRGPAPAHHSRPLRPQHDAMRVRDRRMKTLHPVSSSGLTRRPSATRSGHTVGPVGPRAKPDDDNWWASAGRAWRGYVAGCAGAC